MDLNPSFTFETFVVGPSTESAVRAAREVAETLGGAGNPLFVSGQPGQGKTHLLMALAQAAIRRRPTLNARYMTVLEFAEAFDTAAGVEQEHRFIRRLSELDILLVDDVHLLADRADVQDALGQLQDRLWSLGNQLVVSAARPPDALVGVDERLVSRLGGGLTVHLASPDVETRLTILEQCAATLGEDVAGDVLEAVAQQPVESVRDLLGGLARVVALGVGRTGRPGPGNVGTALETARQDRPPAATAVGPGPQTRSGSSAEFEKFVTAVHTRVKELARGWQAPVPRADKTSVRLGVRNHEKMILTWPHPEERLIEDLR